MMFVIVNINKLYCVFVYDIDKLYFQTCVTYRCTTLRQLSTIAAQLQAGVEML